MSNPKRAFVVATGLGAGFAAVLAAGAFWYLSRPAPQKAWDTKSVQATFDELIVRTEPDRFRAFFTYVLENKTGADFRIEGPPQAVVMHKYPKGGGLAQAPELKWDHPLFLPAGQKVRFTLELPIAYGNDPVAQEAEEVDKITKFFAPHLDKVDGFVLFDEARRLQVELPSGWRDEKPKP